MGRGFRTSVLAILAMLCLTAASPNLLSGPAFRDAYVDALRTAIPDVEVELRDDETFTAKWDADKEIEVNTGNAYRRYREDPDELAAILARYVAVVTQLDEPGASDPGTLVILIRPADYVEGAVRFVAAKPGPPAVDPTPLSRPLAGDLRAYVAVDSATAFSIPAAADLRDKLKLDDAAIWDRALANTTPQLLRPRPPGRKAVSIITTGKGLAASLLVDDAYWDSPRMRAAGPLFVSPVGRDMVVVVRDDGKVLDSLRRIAAEEVGEPDGLSSLILTRRDGAWVVVP